jgi:hypothetical protein
LQRSFKEWINSSSSLGLSLGPGDPLGGEALAGDEYLAAELDLPADDYFNGDVYPLVLLADLGLAGEPPPPLLGVGKALLTKSANSL